LDLHEWDEGDPLSDLFLSTFGAFPLPEETGTDYRALVEANLLGVRSILQNGQEVQALPVSRYSIATLNRAGLDRHYIVSNHWDQPGFYLGEIDNFDDLVHFWNLRAADIPLLFYDPRYASRLRTIATPWINAIRQAPAQQHGPNGMPIWHRAKRVMDADRAHFGDGAIMEHCVNEPTWNGLNVRAPIMSFGDGSALASVSESAGRITVSFALAGQAFNDAWETKSQQYVLSVDPGIGLFGNERSTLHTPFIPELNEFYGRDAHFTWNQARAEPKSLGIVTSISTDHLSLRALDVGELVSRIFETVGIEAAPSKPGLVASTLMRQMGGLDGCRPFKIAGVRSLIENHRPDQSFSRSDAKQTIRGQGGVRPLSEYQWLYIEPQKNGSELTPDAVLSYLLDKGVFRAGLKFDCPSCRLEFWRTLDDSRSRLECDYCGHAFNVAPQLRDKDWAFRRSACSVAMITKRAPFPFC
jgi:hypothetical protein